ncbi:MAG: phosphotransferase [Acidimicrobiia bacterium]|nr:phosphotransferase [Acidimicrobiia bacterium]
MPFGEDGDEDVEVLGGRMGDVVRVDTVVRRSHGPAIVDELLRALERARFDGAPRFIGRDADGTQVLSFVEGYVPPTDGSAWADFVWSDEALSHLGSLLRGLHTAARRSPLVDDGTGWGSPELVSAPRETICHNDAAPWNTVFRDGVPVALVDWDLAAPGPATNDVAYAAWRWAPLIPGRWARPVGFDGDIRERARRVRLLCEAYGIEPGPWLVGEVGRRQEVAIRTMRERAEAGDEAYVRAWDRAGAKLVHYRRWLDEHGDAIARA